MIDWSRPYPVWLYALLAALLLGVVGLARLWAISPRLQRWYLFAPRLAVFGLLGLILLNPVRREELPLPSQAAAVVCLVDGSRSMALDEPVSRIDQVKQAIEQADAAVTGQDRPRIQLFRFGGQLSAAADLAQLQATDDASRLEEALSRLPARFSSDLPRVVVVFSDGTVGQSFPAASLAAIYRRLGVPIHVYPVGSQSIRGDVAVQELVVPRRADRGAKVPVRMVLRSQGYDGERVVVQVRPADRPTAEPLATLPVTLTGGSQPVELVVEANPDFGELLLDVSELAGEAVRTNNRVPFQLATNRRAIKVLYMEGTGGDEYRWLRDALIEDKDIQCVAMVADQQYVQRPRLMRIDDPYKGFPATREELFEYDCVICSDISRGAYTPEQLNWTTELVSQRGGGFAMVGGITSFGAGYWDQTVWDQLIPVDMEGGARGQGWLYHTFQIRIPPEAEQHPIWRILDDPVQNKQALAQIPPFLGTNFIHRLKPAATVIAHSATPIPGVGIMPVFAVESYGRGRTFAFAPDTTADWGRDFESQWGIGDNRYYRRFWRNVVRWLSENSVAGSRRLVVDTDRIIYRAGQPIELTARAYDASLAETVDYRLTAHFTDPDNKTFANSPSVTLLPSAAGRNYRGALAATLTRPGAAPSSSELAGLAGREIEVVARQGETEIARNKVRIQILNDSQELLELQPVPANLTSLAEAAGGRTLTSARELAATWQNLPRKESEVIVTRTPLWDRASVWTLLLVLLATEWILRRRAGFG